MSFTLEKVVLWGRSYKEYLSMFSLSSTDLAKRILGCSDGPAGFNAELTRQGGQVVSIDPIYQFSVSEIKNQIEATYEIVLNETRKNHNEFVWTHIKNVEELGRMRKETMLQFLADYPNNKERYIVGKLPALDFTDNAFDLALCSHFLFLYSEHFSMDFHIQSIVELCRVAQEVRIFPLLELGARKSRHFGEVIECLSDQGYECVVETVAYEFQKGGNEMLRITSFNRNSAYS
jgi:hypothetical protein